MGIAKKQYKTRGGRKKGVIELESNGITTKGIAAKKLSGTGQIFSEPRDTKFDENDRVVSSATGPRILLEYRLSAEKIDYRPLPIEVSESEEAIILSGKNEQGELQTIYIRKKSPGIEAVFHVVEADPMLHSGVLKHYDPFTGTFDWNAILGRKDWSESQLSALKWVYSLDDRKQSPLIPKACVEDRLELLSLMEKHLQSACLESLSILYRIEY